MMLPGSGTVPVVLVLVLVLLLVPRTVNDSEGIDPTEFCEALDGQPGELQPTPEFSSQ
jgi:hypothetical protein